MALLALLRSASLSALAIVFMVPSVEAGMRKVQPPERSKGADKSPAQTDRLAQGSHPEAGASDESKDDPTRPERWSIEGIWAMVHPQRTGAIQFRGDGTFATVGGTAGRWTISGDKGGILLVLLWADGVTDSASMVDADHFSGRTRDGAFTLRRPGGTASGRKSEQAQGPVQIASAMFGSGANRVDVTLELQKLVKDGRLHIKAPWNFGSVDPKNAEKEDLIIHYRVGDRSLTARFRKNEPIVLPKR